jgi:hypothetical protein
MPDSVIVTVPGIEQGNTQQMTDLLRNINDDMDTFDPYIAKVSGTVLTSFERSLIRSYLVWKVMKNANTNEVPNPGR